MGLRLPYFGLLSRRSPMDGLVKHYDKIAECIQIINESIECYVTGGSCKDIEDLTKAIGGVESEADDIKRNIRNHLPRNLFMSVDKTLFLNYTGKQDNILDSAQDALDWLAMRPLAIPEEYQRDLVLLLDGVNEATALLGPALNATIDLVDGKSLEREQTKERYWKVRDQKEKVRKMHIKLTRRVYNSDMDFKDIYQFIHFVDELNDMAHNAAACADILRSMIAR